MPRLTSPHRAFPPPPAPARRAGPRSSFSSSRSAAPAADSVPPTARPRGGRARAGGGRALGAEGGARRGEGRGAAKGRGRGGGRERGPSVWGAVAVGGGERGAASLPPSPQGPGGPVGALLSRNLGDEPLRSAPARWGRAFRGATTRFGELPVRRLPPPRPGRSPAQGQGRWRARLHPPRPRRGWGGPA